MSFFQKIDTRIPLSKQDQKIDPVLYGDPKTSDLYIITSEPNKGFIKYYQRVISKHWGSDVRLCVLYVYVFKPKDNDDKQLGEFVRHYSIDLSKYINPWSKVICTGRAIYTVTQETELKTEAFYAFDYVQSWFFDPKTKSWMFPVDDPYKFISLAGKNFLDTFSFHFFQNQVVTARDLKTNPMRLPELKVEVIEEPNEFLRQYIGKSMKVAWDLETDGLLYYRCRVICLTLSFDGRTGYYLPWNKIDPAVLTDFFEDKYQIGANLKFDVKFLRLNGVENVHIDFDTMAAGHVLNEMRSNSLGTHGWLYTYYGGHEVPLLKYTNAKGVKNYGLIPKKILSDYAAKDAIITFKVYEKELQLLEQDRELRQGKPNLYDYYFNEVVPNINLYTRIEMNGIFMSLERLDEFSGQLLIKKTELEDKIFGEVGHRFNLDSVQVLAKVLEKELGWPDLGAKSKSGDFLTGEEALNEWEKRGYTLATTLKQYKEVSTFIKTFTGTKGKPNSGWREFQDKEGFIHPNYKVMMAESGRQKCDSPNWQQNPKQGTYAKDFRMVFQPPTDSRHFVYSTRSVKLTMEDGTELEFSRYEDIKVNRDGEVIVIKAKDLQEGDDFIKVV